MADIADSASDREQLELERAISAARRPLGNQTVAPPDECANLCGEKPRAGSNYCSADCLRDDERRKAMLKRQGVAR